MMSSIKAFNNYEMKQSTQGNGNNGDTTNNSNSSCLNNNGFMNDTSSSSSSLYANHLKQKLFQQFSTNQTSAFNSFNLNKLIASTYQPQLQPQHDFNNQIIIDTVNSNNNDNNLNKCHVCGDKSTGSHFGGISCESCKAFFRRSVQNSRWLEYKCSYNSECKMNTNTRKICQYCRYNQCLNAGMKAKWVLSDQERQQKYGSRRRKQQQQQQQAQPQVPQLTQQTSQQQQQQQPSPQSSLNGDLMDSTTSDNTNDTTNSGVQITNSPTNINELFYTQGIELIDEKTLKLNEYDQLLIDKLAYAFYYTRKCHSIDLQSIQTKIQALLKLPPDDLQRLSKVLTANFMVQPIKRVITFAKMIPDFRKLNIDDQMSLLRGSTMELFICSAQNLFNNKTNTLSTIISRERKELDDTTQQQQQQQQQGSHNNLQLELLKFIWKDKIYFKTINYFKQMQSLNIDETTLILYLPLVLFSADRRDLKNKLQILNIQTKYSLLLKKYLFYKLNSNIEHVHYLHTQLLLRLIDLRDLHELHSSILVDADSSQLELYSQVLINNNKDELNKLRPTLQNTTSTTSCTYSPSSLSNISSSYESNYDSSPL